MSAIGLGVNAPTTGLALGHKQQLLAYTTSVDLYLALCTVPVNPDADTGATITEALWTGYGRPLVHPGAFPAGDWNAPDQYGRITNANPIIFPNIESAPAGLQANWWALLDSPTVGAGNLRWSGNTPTLSISPLDPVITIPPGLLTLALA